MKKRTSIIIVVCCLAVISITYLSVSKSIGSSLNYEWGQKWKEFIANDNDETVMVVNEVPVTQKQLKSKMKFLAAQQAGASEEAALQALIKQIVLRQEAERRGISVNLQEAESFAETIKKDLLDNQDTPGAKETLEYISATGQTVDEFFKEAVPDYQKALIVGKLRSQVAKETSMQFKSLSQQELEVKQKAEFKKLEQELMEKAQVKIIE
ncbi:hypothetical protein [Syntrophomonas curvata]